MGKFSSSEIDRMAINIFMTALPPSWLPREQRPDVHIDYFVETVENHEPTGVTFGVQLKGTASPKYSRDSDHINFSMKVKHLKYYYDKVKQPVFLILCDIKTGAAYWIFVQEYLDNCTKYWRNNSKLTINIPTKNIFRDTDRFLCSVQESEKFMKRMWPSSIPDAIRGEARRFEEIDDRISVNIEYINGKQHYTLIPKTSFTIAFNFNLAASKKNTVNEALSYGESISFDENELLEITGSAIFKNFSNYRKLQIVPNKIQKGNLEVMAVDDNGVELAKLSNIYGNFFCGTKGMSFRATTPHEEQFFSFRLPFPKNSISNGSYTHSIELKAWNGKKISTLPYFNTYLSFYKNASKAHSLHFDVLIDGYSIYSALAPNTHRNYFMAILSHFERLNILRNICKKLDIDPEYDFDWVESQDKFSTYEMYDDILSFGEFTTKKNIDFKFDTTIDKKSELLSLIKEIKPGHVVKDNVRVFSEHFYFTIFNETIPFPIYFETQDPTINYSDNDLKSLLSGSKKHLHIEFLHTKGHFFKAGKWSASDS